MLVALGGMRACDRDATQTARRWRVNSRDALGKFDWEFILSNKDLFKCFK